MSAIKVKVGDIIPLQAQETNGATDKVVRATLYDLDDFTLLGGPVPLVHQVNGAYFSDEVLMFNVERVYCQYTVFDADGTTPNTTGEQVVFDIFERDDFVQEIVSQIGSATREPDFLATVEAEELNASLDESNMVEAAIEAPGELVAFVEAEDGVATTETGTEINANLEC